MLEQHALAAKAGDTAAFLDDRLLVQPTFRWELLRDDLGGTLGAGELSETGAQTKIRNLLSPRLGLRFDPTTWLALKGNVGQTERAPSFTELFGNRGSIRGNPKLVPERALNADLGFMVGAERLGPFRALKFEAIGFVSVLLIVFEARLVFDVPLRGSLLLLLMEGLLFILVSLSLGMLISSRTSSQRVAMMAAMLGTMLPTMLLSGFIFPIESMPTILQWISNVIPAKWFVTIARAIMLKGVGLDYLWPQTLVLCGMAFVLLGVSTKSFHIRLE